MARRRRRSIGFPLYRIVASHSTLLFSTPSVIGVDDVDRLPSSSDLLRQIRIKRIEIQTAARSVGYGHFDLNILRVGREEEMLGWQLAVAPD